ncbi:LacI family DNA-binding transcriptional regulator [Scandinavium sp. H11S7]|uniref:LacI family DNA-binding transcriptional regulator n=1 Tax=Scandinavium hiltneri TaxID=2926519 RepID=A0ABT2E9M3_9ENTR|nr:MULTISPECIES: LacI family DNA-binding transcriptional regulator [Scandinavium]MCS2158044.1 LacI family DNA-binding transcriptional regulator [Scandinavium hiltneri]MCS2163665.1 LacI family DNA-binding transcriptional regulator [Scandinavium hiltneri]MCS2171840.1 LacI family DNA-binding transcriptional regulator [Scandinavium tedordense]
MNKNRNATLEDVAQRAGVSYQTVSRVLNKSVNVADKTRIRVEQAIEELRYVPNRLAQQLVGKRALTLGLITTSLALHAPSQIAASVKKHAREAHYQVLISMIDEHDPLAIQQSINEFKSQFVDKILINVPLETPVAQALAAQNNDVMCLFLDVAPDSGVFHVIFDPANGTQESVKRLHELGHHSVALMPGPQHSISAQLRLASWVTSLAELGLTPAAIIFGSWDAQSGYDDVRQLIENKVEFSAILAGNDQMALGALSALNQANIAVPAQVSVIGYDDSYESAFFIPSLTTVRLDLDAQGKEAVARVLVATQENRPANCILPAEFVLRDSILQKSCKEIEGTLVER